MRLCGRTRLAVTTASQFELRSKTGMAGKSSKSPWPLIRRLHEERFGDGADAVRSAHVSGAALVQPPHLVAAAAGGHRAPASASACVEEQPSAVSSGAAADSP
jgi:hypothetical protein